MCRGRSFRTGRFQLLFTSELRLKARGFVGSPSDEDTGSTALPREGHTFLTPRGTRRFTPRAMNSRPRDPRTQHRARARPSAGLPRWYSSKESTYQCRSRFVSQVREDRLEKGMATPLQYSCLDNSMDRGAWQATVHGASKIRQG